MGILSDRDIVDAYHKERLDIVPFNERCVQPASYDVHLHNMLYVYPNSPKKDPWAITGYPDADIRCKETMESIHGLAHEVDLRDWDAFVLHQGEFALGAIDEKISLNDSTAARVNGRSSIARLGLAVHAAAGYVDPSWSGRLTLEISNWAPYPIVLFHRMPIAQIIFETLYTPAQIAYGDTVLNSKYQDADRVQLSQANKIFSA